MRLCIQNRITLSERIMKALLIAVYTFWEVLSITRVCVIISTFLLLYLTMNVLSAYVTSHISVVKEGSHLLYATYYWNIFMNFDCSYNNAAYFATSGIAAAPGMNSSRSSEISRSDAIDLYK